MRPATLIFLFAILPGLALPAFAQGEAEALALRLIDSQGCKACHRINQAGASVGPNLEKVGGRLTREQLRGKLVNPQRRHAGGRIADFSHLQGSEIDALVTHLSNHK